MFNVRAVITGWWLNTVCNGNFGDSVKPQPRRVHATNQPPKQPKSFLRMDVSAFACKCVCVENGRPDPEFHPSASAPISSDNLSSCLCLVHPAFGRPCCISAPNLQLQQFDRLSILAVASLLGSGTIHSTYRNKTSDNPPSPPSARSSLNQVEPMIAMSKT